MSKLGGRLDAKEMLDKVVCRMKSRLNGLKSLWRSHGHELILAAVLTAVAIIALLFSGFSLG